MSKPKFNKENCLKCKYHGQGIGYLVKQGKCSILVHCNYTNEVRGSVLAPLDSYTSYDLRGDDYNNCLLFKEVKSEEGY